MTISGHSVETFEEANYATLSRYLADGEWNPASTNQTWEVFWTELSDYDGEEVELADLDGTYEIREDERGEYVQLRQEHGGLFGHGEVPTRLRPFMEESRTDRKPWNPAEADA